MTPLRIERKANKATLRFIKSFEQLPEGYEAQIFCTNPRDIKLMGDLSHGIIRIRQEPHKKDLFNPVR